jgi:hypothetical protein
MKSGQRRALGGECNLLRRSIFVRTDIESSPIWLGPRAPLWRGLDSIDRSYWNQFACPTNSARTSKLLPLRLLLSSPQMFHCIQAGERRVAK